MFFLVPRRCSGAAGPQTPAAVWIRSRAAWAEPCSVGGALRRGRSRGPNQGKILLEAHISMEAQCQLNSINGCISLLRGGFEDQQQRMTDQRKSRAVIGRRRESQPADPSADPPTAVKHTLMRMDFISQHKLLSHTFFFQPWNVFSSTFSIRALLCNSQSNIQLWSPPWRGRKTASELASPPLICSLTGMEALERLSLPQTDS